MIERIKLSGGKIISTNNGAISISANSGNLVARNGEDVISERNSKGEANFRLDGSSYRQNGIQLGGAIANIKAKVGFEVAGSTPSQQISTTVYPRERLVTKFEGSFSAANIRTITHGLGYRPLVIGYFSTSPTFVNKTPFGDQFFTDNTGSWSSVLNVISRSNTTQIELSNVGGYSGTVYYRAFVVAPEDSTVKGNLSAPDAITDLQDSADYNYAKLVKYGSVVVPVGGTITVPHSFGFTPFVQIWQEEAGWLSDWLFDQIFLGQANNPFGSSVWGEPGATSVSFKTDPAIGQPTTVFYRIWGE